MPSFSYKNMKKSIKKWKNQDNKWNFLKSEVKMLTFIAFLLTVAGCINWLLIGLLQYDFIAGLFGYQASMFSRICYIIIGVGCLYLIIRIIVNKGSVKVWEKQKKKKEEVNENLATNNIEASRENVKSVNHEEEKNHDES